MKLHSVSLWDIVLFKENKGNQLMLKLRLYSWCVFLHTTYRISHNCWSLLSCFFCNLPMKCFHLLAFSETNPLVKFVTALEKHIQHAGANTSHIRIKISYLRNALINPSTSRWYNKNLIENYSLVCSDMLYVLSLSYFHATAPSKISSLL